MEVHHLVGMPTQTSPLAGLPGMSSWEETHTEEILAGGHLCILQDRLLEGAGERELWASRLKLLPHDSHEQMKIYRSWSWTVCQFGWEQNN